MKIISTIVSPLVLIAGIGAASAQDVRVPNAAAFESIVPFTDTNVFAGSDRNTGRYDTQHIYGNGPDGQGVLAPFINGIF